MISTILSFIGNVVLKSRCKIYISKRAFKKVSSISVINSEAKNVREVYFCVLFIELEE